MGAESTTEPPVQNAVAPLADMVAVGAGFTVTTVPLEVVEQPPLVTTTE